MYKIEMVDDDGNPQLWTCGSNCVISGISPFFQKKNYLLVPDSYTEMFKQYNPNQCVASWAFPGYQRLEQLVDLHNKSVEDIGAFITAQMTYLGAMAVARYFPMETPDGFIEETLYEEAAIARVIIRLARDRKGLDGFAEKLVLNRILETLMERDQLRQKMIHAVCCQCGEEWECFETYAGFWHSMFSVWSNTEGGCFTVEHLDDTNELEVSNPKAIQSPMLELLRESGQAKDIVPAIFKGNFG